MSFGNVVRGLLHGAEEMVERAEDAVVNVVSEAFNIAAPKDYTDVEDEKLYVVTCVFNPAEYESRYRLYREFKKYIEQFDNVVLVTVELAIGNQEFAVTDSEANFDIQLRTDQIYWNKENLINIGYQNLPPNAKYIAWVDADVVFLNPNWVQDTIDGLKEHKVVQMFSEYIDLDADHRHTGVAASFIKVWKDNRDGLFSKKKTEDTYVNAKYGVTGLAWAARRDVLDNIGGLLDWLLTGASDWYMAYSLIGESHTTNNQLPELKDFQAKCDEFVGKDVGYISGTAVHYFHGNKKNRQYGTRWTILAHNNYSPTTDLTKREDGLYIVNREKTVMLEQLKQYFIDRKEDDVV